MNHHNQNPEQLYVAPFIRRLMPDANEEEILEASENLRQYLVLLYGIYLRQEGRERSEQQKRPDDELIGLS